MLNSELGEYIDAVPAQQRIGESWYLGTADSIYQNLYLVNEEKPEYVLILAWNFAKPIIEKHKAFKETGGRFIVPVPKVEMC